MVKIATMLWEPTDRSYDFSRCYTEEWVERLYDGFQRNLTIPFEFYCFVDREREFKRPIKQVMLERRPIDYGSCIEPYKLTGPKIIVGLDTVIAGNIDHLARYCLEGEKLLLPRDPYRPEQACNGVALVPSGYERMWTEWSGENDMVWCRSFPHEYIEIPFPGAVESYKGHVKNKGLGDTRIVYFHGKEKPHELPKCEWLATHWGPPLVGPIKWLDALNNDRKVMLDQFSENLKRDVPWFSGRPPHADSVLLVGGGPSLADTLGKLRFHHQRGSELWALNNTHDWLIERGITPDVHVLLDSRKDNVEFVRNPKKGVRYFISAFCHPCVFDALEGRDVTLWMNDMEGVNDLVCNIEHKPVVLVGGGATVGLKALFMAYIDGFRKFHFFGFDSSYRDGKNHAYPQPMNDKENRIEVVANGKTFVCAPWMAKQAYEFQGQARELLSRGCSLTVHGDGLITWIMETWNERRQQSLG